MKDKYHLLSYDTPNEATERFYFLEMATLQATVQIKPERKIVSLKISAYDNDNNFVDNRTVESFVTIGEFNLFFQNNSHFHIHDCDIELEGNLHISSHDDGEVSVQMNLNSADHRIIVHLFKENKLDLDLIHVLRKQPRHYLKIDKKNVVIGDYASFDDYIEFGR